MSDEFQFNYPPFVCIASPNDAEQFSLVKEPINQAVESCWVPGTELGKWSRKCYLDHQKSAWIVNEVNFESDLQNLPPPDLRSVTASVIAALHRGDTVVAQFLDKHLSWFQNCASINTFFVDQSSRENVHNITYAQMLDVASVTPNNHRSRVWYEDIMAPFNNLMQKYTLTPPIALYFVMLCEKIMFAPLFFWINTLHSYKFCPLIALTNVMVMRDENLHYQHARMVLSTCIASPPSMKVCNSIFMDFYHATEDLVHRLIDSKVHSEYPLLSKKECLNHLYNVGIQFKIENGLYYKHQNVPTINPNTDFMMSILNDSSVSQMKINLMENIGINYKPQLISEKVEYNFEDSDDDEDIKEPVVKKMKIIKDYTSVKPPTSNKNNIDLVDPYDDGKFKVYGSSSPRKNWLAYAYCPKELIEQVKQEFPRQTDETVNHFEPYADFMSILLSD